LALRLWAPFKSEVDGYKVNVTEQDAAIMMDDLALEEKAVMWRREMTSRSNNKLPVAIKL
jgi:hypothetical protein